MNTKIKFFFLLIILLITGMIISLNFKEYFSRESLDHLPILKSYLHLDNPNPEIQKPSIEANTVIKPSLSNGKEELQNKDDEVRNLQRNQISKILYQHAKLISNLSKVEVLVESSKDISAFITSLNYDLENLNNDLVRKIISLAHEYSAIHKSESVIIFPEKNNKWINWLRYFFVIEKNDTIAKNEGDIKAQALVKAIQELKFQILSEEYIKDLISEF